MMDGVLIIDKPSGITSHGVTTIVKKRLGARKVGHLGTLDPLATGVLPLVINNATRFADTLHGDVKGYDAVLKLGETTDTYDREGVVFEKGDVSTVKEEDIRKVLNGFRGKICQTPPMYSAIKKNGVPLYKLARLGITVERKEREVHIYSLDIVNIAMPYVEFKVVCSKGTYLRSLCYDAGKKLGCGAHLYGLRRTKSGRFSIELSIGLDRTDEVLKTSIIPLESLIKNEYKEVSKTC